MTPPEGGKLAGYWDIAGVGPTSRLPFRDGFAKADLSPDPTCRSP